MFFTKIIFTFSGILVLSFHGFAQDMVNSCPCENCPGLIEDNTGPVDYHLNIFNIQNNELADPNQCVSRVGLTFKHDYVGDLIIELISPAGKSVRLIGPITSARELNGQTSNRNFDVSFVPISETAVPDAGYENRWHNDQNWIGIGTLDGSYYPNKGDLEDFNEGRVNGTWTLRVIDLEPEDNDEGELIDFYVEFCDSEGLVCDPCLDPGDDPVCTFTVDPGEITVVPDEEFCLPIYLENVAFLDIMRFPISWDETKLSFIRVDSFKAEFLNASHFDISNTNNGDLEFNYVHPDFDSLGLVVADSTALFNICFKTIGGVGDSSLVNVSSPPTAIDVNGVEMADTTFDGLVKIAVDSTADCIRAIQLCGNSSVSITKSRGPGFETFEAQTKCEPNGEEFQSKWFQFDILESGELEFMIKPKGAASYGFSLYKNDCPNSGNSEAIDCKSGFPILEGRIIGASNNPSASFEIMNDGGTNFIPSIIATIGETYYLLVDNYSKNGVGFDLFFAGAAIIGDETLRATIIDPATLNCTNPTISLDATASTQGSRYVPIWTTDTGLINTTIGIYQPLISKGGKFTLAIEDTKTGCVSIDSVFVPTDMEYPIAIANEADTLDCNQPTLNLNTAGSSIGNNFEIRWTNLTQTVPNLPPNTSIPIDKGGAYELQITNIENGCVSADTIPILEDFDEPQLSQSDNLISCQTPIANLVASSSTQGVDFEWSGGNLTTTLTEAAIEVNDTGYFSIKVTAPNGCITRDSVFVADERIYPRVEVGDSLILNCYNRIVQLNGNGSSKGANIQYLWTTQKGHFIDGTDQTILNPEIDSSAYYKLSITDISNGCISEDSVYVDSSFKTPSILIEADSILNCYEPSLIIDASKSDSGNIFQFDWFSQDGLIFENRNSYRPIVNQAGAYIFNIRNTQNGCISTQLWSVTADKEAPIANAGQAQTLNCTHPIVSLDGGQSSQGDIFDYQWFTDDGHFISNDSNINVDIDAAGLYILKVINSENGCGNVDSVNISKDFAIPELMIPNDDTLTCRNPILSLSASSETGNTNITWLLPNETQIENAIIEAEIPGQYLVIAKAANGCTNEKTLRLSAEQVLPNIQIEEPELLTCLNETVIIIGENSDNGVPFELVWTTINGLFIDENQINNINPEVKQGGLYSLEITNTATGCISKDSIIVPSSVDRPAINIVHPPEVFSCVNNPVIVEVATDVENAVFQWKLASENISANPIFEATTPGTYTIIIMNRDNNCTSLSSIIIAADTIKPIAEAGASKELNCEIGSVQLDGSASSQGNEFSHLWTNQTNDAIADTTKIEVTLPGLYNLIVVNQHNGCRSIDTVRVLESRDNPIADAGKDTIYCSGAEELDFFLGGNATSKGDNFKYVWFNKSGEIIGFNMNQRVSLAGTYILEVTNLNNQCVTTDSITVFERPRPVISIATNGSINCRENEITYLAESDISTSVINWVGETVVEGNVLVVTDELLGEEFVAIAEDTLTGCLGSSDVLRVTEDRILPLLDAGEDTEVNCADTLRLEGQILSAAIQPSINWRTEDGNIVTNKNELNPIVDAAGTYILTIGNLENFCQNEDTIIVSTNQILPTVAIGADRILTCYEPSLTIFPDSLSRGTNYYYTWKDGNNKIISTEEHLNVDFKGAFQLLVIDSTNLCTKSDIVEVMDSLNPPEIEIEMPESITCFINQTTLITNINIDDATYEWTILSESGNILGPNNNPNLVVNEAGIYQVQVTNNFSGCMGIRNIGVEDLRNEFGIEAGGNKTITCANNNTVTAIGSIFIDDDSNLVYKWTSDNPNFVPIDSTLTINIKETGVYFFTVTDTLSQCTEIDAFEVDRDVEAITFELSPTLTINCAKETVVLGDLNDNGQENYIYEWTTKDGNIVGADNLPNIVANRAGTYQIYIENTQNGCTYQNEQFVIEDISKPSIDIGEPKILTCIQSEAILGGENTDVGNNFCYKWATQNGNIIEGVRSQFASVNQAGIYQFTVLDTTNSCENIDSITIVEDKKFPDFSLPNNLSFSCTDESIAITIFTEENIDNLKTIWHTENGLLLSDKEDFIAQAGAAGWYFASIEDITNSCIREDSILVLDNRELPKVTNLADQMLGCRNENITLDAQGSETGKNIAYQWLNTEGNTLSNNTTLTIDEPGQYILQVTNQENTCVSADTVLISENINPPTGGELIIESPTCDRANNGFIEVMSVTGGTPPFHYSLDAADSSFVATFPNLAPQNYTLTITDELACQWDTMIVLNQPQPIDVIIESFNSQLLTGQEATFSFQTSIPETAIADILWTPTSSINCDNCFEITTSFNSNTTIGLIITDTNGCQGTDSIKIMVELAPVPNAITPNGDGANDFFMIPDIEQQPDAFPDSELIIFNRWGDVLFRATPYNNDWNGTNNNGQPLGEGTYYYVLRLDTREGVIKKGDITILRR